MTLVLFEVFEEEVEVFGVAEAEAEAAMIDAGVSLAARLPEGDTEPTPAERMVVLLAIDDAGRAGRRGAEESMATLRTGIDKRNGCENPPAVLVEKITFSCKSACQTKKKKKNSSPTMRAVASFSQAPSARSVAVASTSGRTVVASMSSYSMKFSSSDVR